MIVKLTRDADKDVAAILDYTLLHFGWQQAENYYEGLRARFEAIAAGTAYRTDYSFVRQGMWRSNYLSHAIYYRLEPDCVLVLRVLGQRQDTQRHF